MFAKATLSALALTLAVPAFAGATQLERAAGVEPGIFTLAQLTEIVSADEAKDAARLKSLYATGGGDVSRADFSITGTTGSNGFSRGSDR